VGYDFVDAILNPMGGSNGNDGGNDSDNNVATWFKFELCRVNCQDVTCELSNNCVL
jgi:hypothetical protein